MTEQLALFDYAHWVTSGQYLAAITEAMIRVGHLAEPEYGETRRRRNAWPTLRRWLARAKPIHQDAALPCAAILQTSYGERCVDVAGLGYVGDSYRYLLVSIDGYVVGESEWVSTEGGARGWLGRNTTPWTESSGEAVSL